MQQGNGEIADVVLMAQRIICKWEIAPSAGHLAQNRDYSQFNFNMPKGKFKSESFKRQ